MDEKIRTVLKSITSVGDKLSSMESDYSILISRIESHPRIVALDNATLGEIEEVE